MLNLCSLLGSRAALILPSAAVPGELMIRPDSAATPERKCKFMVCGEYFSVCLQCQINTRVWGLAVRHVCFILLTLWVWREVFQSDFDKKFMSKSLFYPNGPVRNFHSPTVVAHNELSKSSVQDFHGDSKGCCCVESVGKRVKWAFNTAVWKPFLSEGTVCQPRPWLHLYIFCRGLKELAKLSISPYSEMVNRHLVCLLSIHSCCVWCVCELESYDDLRWW